MSSCYLPTLFLTLGATLAGQAQTVKNTKPLPTLVAQQLTTDAAPAPASIPTYHLTGRVFSPLGRPLPGATLSVPGTANIVSTDATGRFTLTLPAGAGSTLVAGYAGYEDQTLKVSPGATAPLTVNLRPSTTASVKGPARALRTGDLAPDFELPTTTGTLFKLSAHRGHPVVLYFYPKDGSSGCTKEACSFRDQYKDFTDLGAEVIGISSDDAQSHQQFTEKYQLPFPLLTDAGGQLRKQYAVPRAVLGLLPGRVTYVLDGEGRVRYVFNSLTEATSHVLNAKDILRDIQ
ncbi:redoxin domain-containing protein [Hymenobacter sp. H14-R3]|uniref:redoxin domain-containing protein n=1 Tax=Hymenobacter sp. H14-R3 TaxID=3046308 RepID=UPI0024B8E189|nr:redoxin domain-containing protein [Hymenobacter sp. H14-R3]MDJ0365877.1 redoxin domain-containing protein [Hymenobacter sp. H14-R3]